LTSGNNTNILHKSLALGNSRGSSIGYVVKRACGPGIAGIAGMAVAVLKELLKAA
jgi:hypothetical protein